MKNCFIVIIPVVFIALLTQVPSTALAKEKPASEFSSSTIDLGIVVSDIEKSVQFYTKAVGFTEVKGFSVPAKFCKDVGLTSGSKLDIRVLVLGEGKTATKIKLMQVAGVKPKKSNNKHIHSQLGFSYITVHINSTAAATKRLKAAGIKPIAKSPLSLPKGFPEGISLTIVRDPDGNLVELVGPSAKK